MRETYNRGSKSGGSAVDIEITQFVTGPIETNSYLIASEAGECLVVDPSSGCHEILAAIREGGMKLAAVVLTHAHFDHIMGISELLAAYPAAEVWVHPLDRPLLSNADLNGSLMLGRRFAFEGPVREILEGENRIGGFTFEVRHVPGHTPGGCALIFGDVCLSGDVLFAGSIGRSDLPGGDGEQLIESIRSQLLTLPGPTHVLPGHGPQTTVRQEKHSNPFLM